MSTASITQVTNAGSMPTLAAQTVAINGIKSVSATLNGQSAAVTTASGTATYTPAGSVSLTAGTPPSLDLNSAASDAKTYVTKINVTKNSYTPGGTVSSITPSGSVTLGSNTTSTDGVPYVASMNVGANYTAPTLSTAQITEVSSVGTLATLTSDTTSSTGAIGYIKSVSNGNLGVSVGNVVLNTSTIK